ALDELREKRRRSLVRRQLATLANREPDVVSSEVAHRQGSHRKTERFHHSVHLLRGRTLFQEALRFCGIELPHTIADEAIAVPREHSDLTDTPRQRHGRSQRLRRALVSPHDFEQLHHLRGTEKVQTNDPLWMCGCAGYCIDVEGGRIGRQNGTGSYHGAQAPEDLLLEL